MKCKNTQSRKLHLIRNFNLPSVSCLMPNDDTHTKTMTLTRVSAFSFRSPSSFMLNAGKQEPIFFLYFTWFVFFPTSDPRTYSRLKLRPCTDSSRATCQWQFYSHAVTQELCCRFLKHILLTKLLVYVSSQREQRNTICVLWILILKVFKTNRKSMVITWGQTLSHSLNCSKLHVGSAQVNHDYQHVARRSPHISGEEASMSWTFV